MTKLRKSLPSKSAELYVWTIQRLAQKELTHFGIKDYTQPLSCLVENLSPYKYRY